MHAYTKKNQHTHRQQRQQPTPINAMSDFVGEEKKQESEITVPVVTAGLSLVALIITQIIWYGIKCNNINNNNNNNNNNHFN